MEWKEQRSRVGCREEQSLSFGIITVPFMADGINIKERNTLNMYRRLVLDGNLILPNRVYTSFSCTFDHPFNSV